MAFWRRSSKDSQGANRQEPVSSSARQPLPSGQPPAQAARQLSELCRLSATGWDDVADYALIWDRDALDEVWSSNRSADSTASARAEMRAIGRQLDLEGGLRRMLTVFELVQPLPPAERPQGLLSVLWDGIGEWQLDGGTNALWARVGGR